MIGDFEDMIAQANVEYYEKGQSDPRYAIAFAILAGIQTVSKAIDCHSGHDPGLADEVQGCANALEGVGRSLQNIAEMIDLK